MACYSFYKIIIIIIIIISKRKFNNFVISLQVQICTFTRSSYMTIKQKLP